MSTLGVSTRMIRVMLGCPGDVQAEVDIFFEEIQQWNSDHSEEYKIMLLPKHWTTHTHPRLGDRAQGIVNSQLSDKADVLIALFGTRLGTSTSVEESGTVEEIMRFYESGRPVKLYFAEIDSLTPQKASQEAVIAELKRLALFRERAQQMGLYSTYRSIDGFRKQISRDIMREVRVLRDSDFSVNGVEPIKLAPVAAIPESYLTFKRSVERLSIQWRSEANSQLSGYDQGKLIMARLGVVLSTHLPELAENYGSDVIEKFETPLKDAKAIEQSQVVFGREFSQWFWDTGTQTFVELSKIIATMQSTPA